MELPVRHKLLELELLDLQLPELEFDPLLNVNSFLSSFIIFVKGKKKERKKNQQLRECSYALKTFFIVIVCDKKPAS